MTLPTSPSHAAAYVDIATAISAIAAAWLTAKGSTLLVEDDNRKSVDVASSAASAPFLSWQMMFRGGGQMSLGKDPLARTLGQVFLTTKVKEGSGARKSLELLDFAYPYLSGKNFTVVELDVGETYDAVTRQGFYCIPAVFNFKVNYIAPSA